MSAYQDRCAAACTLCAAGKKRIKQGENWYRHIHGYEELSVTCTAPTLEEFAEELAAQVQRLERELSSAKVTIATLSDQDTVQALTRSLEDVKGGRILRLSEEDL